MCKALGIENQETGDALGLVPARNSKVGTQGIRIRNQANSRQIRHSDWAVRVSGHQGIDFFGTCLFRSIGDGSLERCAGLKSTNDRKKGKKGAKEVERELCIGL